MFRVPFLIAITLAVAFGGGVWSTLKALDATVGFGGIRLGAWEAFPNAQTEKADPYAKSHRANAGRLLYASAEGLVFTANVDETGARLDASCSYRLSGHTPAARFWTLYAAVPGSAAPSIASDLPTALNSRAVLRDSEGGFDIAISASARPGNWLTVTGSGPFRLVMTLLDTPAAGNSGLIDLSMPRIEKTGCGNA